jgi:hypothetical protein
MLEHPWYRERGFSPSHLSQTVALDNRRTANVVPAAIVRHHNIDRRDPTCCRRGPRPPSSWQGNRPLLATFSARSWAHSPRMSRRTGAMVTTDGVIADSSPRRAATLGHSPLHQKLRDKGALLTRIDCRTMRNWAVWWTAPSGSTRRMSVPRNRAHLATTHPWRWAVALAPPGRSR